MTFLTDLLMQCKASQVTLTDYPLIIIYYNLD